MAWSQAVTMAVERRLGVAVEGEAGADVGQELPVGLEVKERFQFKDGG